MSAESPRRGLHKGAQVISPQPISDRSIIDSVAGIINDIVPQAYTGAPNSDNKESITWARFEYADVNNSAFFPDYIEGSATSPLLLVLGYTTGVQVWVIAASGEATEVLSWRQGIVRNLRILSDPRHEERDDGGGDNADPFASKRPLVAICDSSGPGPQFCSVNFVSLRTGEQTKSIKFKNPVCDVLANRRSVVVTFSERIAVFDARTLEDVLTVTTCYPSPGAYPNPVALGTRWLAYSEKKLLPARRSSGGSEGEGVQSYTATVLYAAKSLGKGLRGLGETVASSLTGNSIAPVSLNNIGSGDLTQPGVVTILDLQAAKEEKQYDDPTIETVVAHFTAHNDAIVAMTFDLTGALLMTADKRGHDFHVFRIQPHPGGPTLAAVHHLYVLHRGDTTAKVQDMMFSSDTRWAAISTVRGTTHVFPVAPYGGPVGVRTHSTPHVVNRLSRFHRSAGLTDDGTRSHSPVSHAELPVSVYPYSNPRLPPYPHPTILHPLAQIRQPSTLNHANSQSQPSRPQQRQRLYSDDNGSLPLKICACFAPPRAWIYAQRDSANKLAKRAVDSLFIMACHGNMIQYDLEPKPAAGVPKEKICDDTTIELEVEAKGQWPLLRTPNSLEIVPPLTTSSPLLSTLGSPKTSRQLDSADDRWLSQVEIVTHAGPHRRLWMGPQFVFKTYNAPSGVNLIESEAIEIGVTGGSRPARSNPVNMPHAAARPLVPIVIDGSGSSYEQSPRFMEAYGDSLDNDTLGIGNGENQLREDLAEAMLETSTAPHRAAGRRLVVERVGQPVTKVVNPLGTVITVMADEEESEESGSHELGDTTPEPPRSLCAEEGPASLGDDFEAEEGQDLRKLSEICAEMRSMREPAIDSVPDENIKEVRENKSLCVGAIILNRPGVGIDYEREDSFREVPTSLSLCAEKGEIPESPMSVAREANWTSKRTIVKRDESLQESSSSSAAYANAKYVVNYDEDSVVLMENTSGNQLRGPKSGKPEVGASRTTAAETERGAWKKRPGKLATSSRATKRSTCAIRETPKYLLHEHEDTIVIEDTTMKKSLPGVSEDYRGTLAREENIEEAKFEDALEEICSRPEDSPKNAVSTVPDLPEIVGEAMIVESRISEDKMKASEAFVDLKVVGRTLEDEEPRGIDPEPMEACVATGQACLPQDEPPMDELTCMDYHIVETGSSLPTRDGASSQQSDDDIEHIQSSELVSQMLEIAENPEDPSETSVSPMRQRKSSKSAISDDDIEHFNTADLVEARGAAVSLLANKNLLFAFQNPSDISEEKKDFSPLARDKKNILAYLEDDIEHVYHSEIKELQVPVETIIDSDSARSKVKAASSGRLERNSNAGRWKGSKKRRDVVVIDSETSETPAEVTVIVKSQDCWNKSKSQQEIDLSEEIDRCLEPRELSSDRSGSSSLPKKTRIRTPKTSTETAGTASTGSTCSPAANTSGSSASGQKRQPSAESDMVEIIDIDAMTKAELEVMLSGDCVSAPECKILGPRRESTSSSRSQKSRRNKKAHLDVAASGGSSVASPEIPQNYPINVPQEHDISSENFASDDPQWDDELDILERFKLTPKVEESRLENSETLSWSSILKKSEGALASPINSTDFPSLTVENRDPEIPLGLESVPSTTPQIPETSTVVSSGISEIPRQEEKTLIGKKRGRKNRLRKHAITTVSASPSNSGTGQDDLTQQCWDKSSGSEQISTENSEKKIVAKESADDEKNSSDETGKMPREDWNSALDPAVEKAIEEPEPPEEEPEEGKNSGETTSRRDSPEKLVEAEKTDVSSLEPRPSSSDDDLNANIVVPMDTEDDSTNSLRHTARPDKMFASTTVAPAPSPVYTTTVKRKEKKKKKRE